MLKMAFKALLGIMLVFFLMSDVARGESQDGHDGGEVDHLGKPEMGMDKEDKMMKNKMMRGRKMKKEIKNDMKGRPMMCYTKKNIMGKGTMTKEGDNMMQTLMNQAARLLGVIMKRTEGNDDMDPMTLKEITKMVQRMIKETGDMKEGEMGSGSEDQEENTELGMELLGIVQNLIGEGGNSRPGVAVTESDDETESMGEENGMTMMGSGHSNLPPPMNDKEMGGEATRPVEPPGLFGSAQSGPGMTMTDMLNLILDPNMADLVQSLGMGPLAEIIEDPEIMALMEGLNMDMITQLLRSGKLSNDEGGVNVTTILNLIRDLQDSTDPPTVMPKTGDKEEGDHGMQEKEEGMGKKLEKTTTSEIKEGKERKIKEAFYRILSLAGVEGVVNEDNLISSIMKAIQFIMTADNESVQMLLESVDDLDTGEPSQWRIMMGSGKMNMSGAGDKEAMMASFNRIMKLSGFEGQVTMDNMMESVMQALQYILSVDKQTLEMIIVEIGGDTEMYKTGMKHSNKTVKEMKQGNEQVVMEAFKKIMAMAGIQDEVSEENIMELVLKAMQYILEADDKTLQMMVDSLGDLDLSMLEIMGQDVVGDNEDEGIEMICHPMNEYDMQKYMMTNGNEMTAMKEDGGYDEEEMDDNYMENGEMDGNRRSMGMNGGKCINCEKQMDEMKQMIQDMIEAEIGKVLNNVASTLSGVHSIAPEITTVLEKMANRGIEVTLQPVSAADRWDDWRKWGTCSRSCGGGISIRTRVCKEEYVSTMIGETGVCEESESRPCNMQECEMYRPDDLEEGGMDVDKIDKWAPWSEWDPCTQTCGRGILVRSRMCTTAYMLTRPDDLDCEASESIICNDMPCPTVTPDGPQWLQWGDWEQCSSTCGGGTTIRRRVCVRKSETTSCEQVQTRSCEEAPCIVTTQAPNLPFWKDWDDWTECTVTCGSGVSVRRRMCNYPAEENCMDIETRTCQQRECDRVLPVSSGRWGRWSDWTICTRTCGGGTRTRRRNCEQGMCIGALQDTESCNRQVCTQFGRDRIPTEVRPRPSVVPQQPRFMSTRSPGITQDICPRSRSQYRNLRYEQTCMVFYGRGAGMMNFADYRSYCQERGGDLVRMENVMKWVQITYWMKGIMNTYSDKEGGAWIGLTDSGRRGRWSHPALPNAQAFTIWSKGEPAETNQNQCGHLNVMTGHAISSACDAKHYAICEFRG